MFSAFPKIFLLSATLMVSTALVADAQSISSSTYCVVTGESDCDSGGDHHTIGGCWLADKGQTPKLGDRVPDGHCIYKDFELSFGCRAYTTCFVSKVESVKCMVCDKSDNCSFQAR